MKILSITFFLMLLSICMVSQDRVIKGYAYDNKSGLLIKGARLKFENLDTIIISNQFGTFSINVPKQTNKLLIAIEGYEAENIPLTKDNQEQPIWIGFQSSGKSKSIKSSSTKNHAYRQFKNSITLSPLELVTGAVAIRYERKLAKKHSTGLHASFYLFGRNPFTMGSEHDYYVKYQGFKLSPFYRFYPTKSTGLFIDAKIPFGYIHFSELDYHYGSNSYPRKYIEYNTWTYGVGISVGFAFKLPKSEHGVINLSIGYQYFPIDVPETIQMEVSDETTITLQTDTYWWYLFGPGARFDFKFTIGGIF